MTPTAWTVLVSLLGLAVTILLFALNRLLGKLDARDAEIKMKDETILTQRFALMELKGTARALDRTLSGIPTIAERQEGGDAS